jgi:hypothetical protein
MARFLEFIALGEQGGLALPNLRCVPLAAAKNARALYERRLEAMRSSEADYLCFVDGGEDAVLPGFAAAMQALADADMPIGYAAELVHGQAREHKPFTLRNYVLDFAMIHHGVVCRRKDLLAIDWPTGVYSWEVLAYGALAQRGFAYDPTPRYDWRPGPDGARLWPSYAHGVINSLRWLQGLDTTKKEKIECRPT